MQRFPTWVEVNLDTLNENLEVIRRAIAPDVEILLTIKADAYGHGAVQVAQTSDERVDWFGVATLDEAFELRKAEISKRILILSPVLEKEIPSAVDNDIAVTVSSRDFALAVSDYANRYHRSAEVHIEVDTGMGRTGFLPDEAETLVLDVAGLPGVRVGGLFTHFPESDTDPGFTRDQTRHFARLVRRVRAAGLDVPLIHSANSAAISAVPESHLQLVRPGLVAYGHQSGGLTTALTVRPVMSWKSRLVQVRRVPKGRTISYGRTFTTARDTVMGVVPVGYGHGYPFRLSNRGEMIVAGKRVPVLGRVTMDMTMVDLTGIAPAPKPGDEVVLMGEARGETVSVDELARWAGSISYEILCGISKRVPRIYLRGGKIEAFKTLLGVIPNHIGA
ncbi:MAG: alanine racemase [Candidatus Latescibacterota bacterium]|nr:MAG: alanine racemase [Candidatus Latescibacterota bacterium]